MSSALDTGQYSIILPRNDRQGLGLGRVILHSEATEIYRSHGANHLQLTGSLSVQWETVYLSLKTDNSWHITEDVRQRNWNIIPSRSYGFIITDSVWAELGRKGFYLLSQDLDMITMGIIDLTFAYHGRDGAHERFLLRICRGDQNVQFVFYPDLLAESGYLSSKYRSGKITLVQDANATMELRSDECPEERVVILTIRHSDGYPHDVVTMDIDVAGSVYEALAREYASRPRRDRDKIPGLSFVPSYSGQVTAMGRQLESVVDHLPESEDSWGSSSR